MAKKKIQVETPKIEEKIVEIKPVISQFKGVEKILTEKQKEGKKAILEAKKKMMAFIAGRRNKTAPAKGANLVSAPTIVQIEPKVTGVPKATSESVIKLVAEKNKIRQEYAGKLFPAGIVKRLEEIDKLIKA